MQFSNSYLLHRLYSVGRGGEGVDLHGKRKISKKDEALQPVDVL
jgi:hypothetical protein